MPNNFIEQPESSNGPHSSQMAPPTDVSDERVQLSIPCDLARSVIRQINQGLRLGDDGRTLEQHRDDALGRLYEAQNQLDVLMSLAEKRSNNEPTDEVLPLGTDRWTEVLDTITFFVDDLTSFECDPKDYVNE
jgi:hypothetical protein